MILVAAARGVAVASAGGALYGPALGAFLTYAFVNAQFSSDVVGNRMLWLAIALAVMAPLAQPVTAGKGEQEVALAIHHR